MALYQNKTRKEDGNYDSGEPIKNIIVGLWANFIIEFLGKQVGLIRSTLN